MKLLINENYIFPQVNLFVSIKNQTEEDYDLDKVMKMYSNLVGGYKIENMLNDIGIEGEYVVLNSGSIFISDESVKDIIQDYGIPLNIYTSITSEAVVL
jgi:hypothetical protein